MPQQLLDLAQVGPAVEQMGCGAVTQRMRTDVGHAGRARGCVDHLAHHALVHPPASRAQKHGRPRCLVLQHRPPPFQPAFQRPSGGCPERHHPLLVSLSGHLQRTVGEGDVAAVQRHQFGHANPRGIQQFQHRVVPQSDGVTPRVVAVGDQTIRRLVQQAFGLGLVQDLRQVLRDLRRHQRGRRVGRNHPMLMGPEEEPPHRHHPAGHARTRVGAGLPRHPHPQVIQRDLPQLGHAAPLHGLQARPHVTRVRRSRVLAQPPVGLQIGQIPIQFAFEPHDGPFPFPPFRHPFSHADAAAPRRPRTAVRTPHAAGPTHGVAWGYAYTT